MFIEKHNLHATTSSSFNPTLAFVKSVLVKAYPCGRRKSTLVTEGEQKYNIPFDPEARLNTELNNRSISASNGYTSSYIKEWNEDSKRFSLVLGGYSFELSLPDDIDETKKMYFVNNFGKALITYLEKPAATVIYANIRLEETPLFRGEVDYDTWILRDQTDYGQTARSELDVEISEKIDLVNQEQNYYFSGLSFSTEPLTDIDDTRSRIDITTTRRPQQVYSLCIMKKVGDTWYLNETAKLPKIEHGEAADSIRVDHFESKAINYVENTVGGPVAKPVAVLEVIPPTSPNTKYKLKFTKAKS
jgi:hypothetical protein